MQLLDCVLLLTNARLWWPSACLLYETFGILFGGDIPFRFHLYHEIPFRWALKLLANLMGYWLASYFDFLEQHGRYLSDIESEKLVDIVEPGPYSHNF